MGNSDSIASDSNTFGNRNASGPRDTSQLKFKKEIEQIVSMGFDESVAAYAIQEANGDVTVSSYTLLIYSNSYCLHFLSNQQ